MKENKKSKIPYIFFAFFATFITADLTLIYIAQKNWRGTVTENSYEKGRKYNKTLINDQKQQNLGWKVDLKHKNINSKESILILDLKDKDDKLIENAQIKLQLVRPTQTGYDFSQKLTFNLDEKNYQKLVTFPLIGLWKVEAQIFADDKVFQYVKRIVID
jgi:nitrogen fixation protein FixH